MQDVAHGPACIIGQTIFVLIQDVDATGPFNQLGAIAVAFGGNIQQGLGQVRIILVQGIAAGRQVDIARC